MSAFGFGIGIGNGNGNGNGAVNREYNHDCVTCRTLRRECNGCFIQNYNSLYNNLGDYLLVHHTYDPANIVSMLDSVPLSSRQRAANSLATEATIRRVDPVGGCLGFIQHIEADIKYHEEMLRNVRKQLAIAKGDQPEEDPTPTVPAICLLHQWSPSENPSTDGERICSLCGPGGERICDICGQGICKILDPKITSRATAPPVSLGTDDEEETEEDTDTDLEDYDEEGTEEDTDTDLEDYDEEGTEEDTDADSEDSFDHVYFL